MKRTKPFLKIISVICVFISVFCGTGIVDSFSSNLTDSEQSEIDAYKAEQDALSEKIAENKKKLSELKSDIARQQEYVNTLQSQIDAYQDQINSLNESIALLGRQKAGIQAKIDELTEEIDGIHAEIKHNELMQIDLQQEVEDTYTELEDRLCDIYMYGTTSELELLFDSTDFKSFLITLELTSGIAEHDKKIVDTLNTMIAEIEALNAEHNLMIEQLEAKQAEHQGEIDDLDEKEREIVASRLQVEKAQSDVTTLERDAQNYLDQLDTESDTYKALVSQYEADMAAFEKRIDAIIAAAKKRELTFVPSAGLIWPLQYPGTYISSPFGYRTDPATGVSKFHGGVDTCVSGGTYGKSVRAAANGTVLTASYMANGYGYYVLIDHGKGIYTLYGHNSQLLVSTGQTVKQGDVIAYAGSTGYATGAHVHFEVRVNGNKVNPLNYASLP